MSWTAFIHRDDLEMNERLPPDARIDPGSAPSSYEFRFVNRKGQVRSLFMSVAVIPGTKDSVAP